MKLVIVTLSFVQAGRAKSYDMEMPCHIPAEKLCREIRQTIQAYQGAALDGAPQGKLFSRRLDRTLRPEETFEAAGIRNGDYIDLR